MKKIEFDVINGVVEVCEFDDNVKIVDNFEMDDLRGPEITGINGAVISDELFAEIDSEYGITKV